MSCANQISWFGRYENSEVGNGQFVCELIEDAGVDLNIKFLMRIGIKTEEKIRPIKVVLESGHERYLHLKNLMNLKEKHSTNGLALKKISHRSREASSEIGRIEQTNETRKNQKTQQFCGECEGVPRRAFI